MFPSFISDLLSFSLWWWSHSLCVLGKNQRGNDSSCSIMSWMSWMSFPSIRVHFLWLSFVTERTWKSRPTSRSLLFRQKWEKCHWSQMTSSSLSFTSTWIFHKVFQSPLSSHFTRIPHFCVQHQNCSFNEVSKKTDSLCVYEIRAFERKRENHHQANLLLDQVLDSKKGEKWWRSALLDAYKEGEQASMCIYRKKK
jgi:hypothetical protein